jgi:hypothetical protein
VSQRSVGPGNIIISLVNLRAVETAASQVPLFKDDPRGGRIFALVFVWVMTFVISWQVYWYWQIHLGIVNDPFARPFDTLCFFSVFSIGLTFVVILLQIHFVEKVYPLLYITPIADMIIIQFLFRIGVPGGSGCLSILIFMIAVNAIILALSWDEMANRSGSGVSGLWMSIMPIACLMILTSAGICKMSLVLEQTGAVPVEWILWPVLWILLSVFLLFLFVWVDRRPLLPTERWMLPTILLVWTILTFILGPPLILLTGLNDMVILAVLTSAMVQFGVATAEFEAIMQFPEGKAAVGLALIGGYVGALLCVIFAWFMILPFPASLIP